MASLADVLSVLGSKTMGAATAKSPVPTAVPAPVAVAPVATPPTAPPTNPFAGLVDSLPQSGYAGPASQAWLQQALGQPYMQGWGPPQDGAAANAPGTTSTGPQNGTPYTFSGDISPEAMKIKKQIKKMRGARGWSPGDIAKIGGSIALGVMTGGSSLAGQALGGGLSALSGIAGTNAANKGAAGSLHQYQKLKTQYLPNIGWTQTKGGGWTDASGTKMSTAQIVQTLMNLGAWG